MIHTMYESKGIGLAATQVDFHERILVIDISEERDDPQVFINPEVEILNKEEKSGYEEGCLSVPGFYEEIIRPEKIKVTYLDRDGKKQTLMPEGLLAVVIQHEIDHLDGKLFIDYLSKLKKDMIIKKLVKQKKEQDKIVL